MFRLSLKNYFSESGLRNELCYLYCGLPHRSEKFCSLNCSVLIVTLHTSFKISNIITYLVKFLISKHLTMSEEQQENGTAGGEVPEIELIIKVSKR